MATKDFNRWRGIYGGLVRDRAPDDPELLAAYDQMRAESLVGAIQNAMRKAAPMTEALRNRIVALLEVRR